MALMLLIGTAGALRPAQREVLKRMRTLRDGLIRTGETYLHRRISYSSMGPSIFGALEIRNLRIADAEGRNLLTAETLSLRYSFFRLLRGDLLGALREIRLGRPALFFDAEKDADLLELISPYFSDLSGAPGLPKDLRVGIRNGEAQGRAQEKTFLARGVAFDATLRENRIRFRGNGTLGLPLGSLPQFKFAFRLSGDSRADLENGTATCTFQSLADEALRFQPLTLNLTLADNRLALRKINDQSAFDFSIAYNLKTERLTGAFRCEGFSPQDSIAFAGPWQNFTPWLQLKISGSLAFEQAPDTPFRYTLNLYGASSSSKPQGKGLAFDIRGAGNLQEAALDDGALYIGAGSIRYRGRIVFSPAALEGTLSFLNAGFTETSGITGRLTIASEDRRINLLGRNVAFGDKTFSEIRGAALFGEKTITFEAALKGEKEESLKAEGFYEAGYAEMHLALDALSAEEGLALARPFVNLPDLPISGISLNAKVYGSTDFTHFSFHIPALAAVDADQTEVFSALLSGTDQRFQLHRGRIRWKGEDITLIANADFTEAQTIIFALDATYFDKQYAFEGAMLDRNTLTIQGLYGLSLSLHSDESGSYSGVLEARNVPVPYRGRPGRCSINASWRYESPEAWSFDLHNFEVADIFTTYSANPIGTSLKISGQANQAGAAFRDVYFNDGRGALRGGLTAAWPDGFSSAAGNLSLEDETKTEWYDITAGLTGKGFTLSFSGKDMQLGRFLPFNPVVSGSLDVLWDSKDSFSGSLRLDSLTARFSDRDVYLTGRADIDTETLNLREVTARFGEVSGEVSALTINRRTSQADAAAQIQFLSPQINGDLSFTLGLTFKPLSSWFSFMDAIDEFEGFLSVEACRFNTVRSEEPFKFVFSRAGERVRIFGGPRDMIRVMVSDTGDFYAGFSNPSPIRGVCIGSLNFKENRIDVQTQNLYVDLTSLWRIVPSEVKNTVNITGGFATASVRIVGNLGDPEFFGSAQGNGIRLGIPKFLTADIRPVPIVLTFEGAALSFGPLPAGVGEGQGTVAGTFHFDRWIPDTFDLEIRVPRSSPIPFGFDLLGILSYGKASGNLNLSLRDLLFTVAGDLTADETEITLSDISSEAGTSQDAPVGLAVDLKITSGKKMEFMWPNAEWPIIQAYVALGNSVRITSNSLANQYSIIGEVQMQGGEFFYFERSFFIQNARLIFNENQNRFEPRLTARAEVRDQVNNEPVTIAMIIDNAPLTSFTPRFEATPPMSQTEIVSLLGQSFTGIAAGSAAPSPETPAGSGNTAMADPMVLLTSATDLLVQTQLYRKLIRGVRNFFPFIDMLSFRTQILQNALLIEYRKRSGFTDVNGGEYVAGIGNYFDNTSVFIGKYVTPDMFFQSTLSLRQSKYYNDVQGFNLENLQIESDFGIDLKSPFFNIQVNLSFLYDTRYFKLEQPFISDVSFAVSLIRRKSSWEEMFSFLKPAPPARGAPKAKAK
ncbi:MAG: translocation/assembly module TamB [Spirochaetaceae bacterium]|jgi:hypothetical protein|nr:translocation/assembly module TamB [Spirochaetaceae bacterium]